MLAQVVKQALAQPQPADWWAGAGGPSQKEKATFLGAMAALLGNKLPPPAAFFFF